MGSVRGPLWAASIVMHMTGILMASAQVPKMGTNEVARLGHGLQEVSHNDANKRRCKPPMGAGDSRGARTLEQQDDKRATCPRNWHEIRNAWSLNSSAFTG